MNTIESVQSSRPIRALSLDQLRYIAPSIFAERPRPGVSQRYSFVSTAQVVDLLQGEGWEPVKATEQKVRIEQRAGYQMHEIRFARRSDLESRSFHVGESRLEMILQNAHDGTRAYRIDAGLFRLVCSNGLVVSDSAFAHVAIRHLDVSAERFLTAAQAVAENSPKVLDVVTRWSNVLMSETARKEFASKALALRWGSEKNVRQLLKPEALLIPARSADHGGDLWRTFNTVQEKLLNGGTRYWGFIRTPEGEVATNRFVRNTTRQVAGLQEGQKLNKRLWALAEEFSRN